MSRTLLVLGDSVPAGGGPGDGAVTPWPARVVAATPGLEGPVTVGTTGTTLAALADARERHLADADRTDCVAVVHAGHNDAQTAGGEPRVPRERFRAAATTLDDALAAHPGVERAAVLGLVPLLPGVGVPFGDDQPARSLAYDDDLAGTVRTHLPVARPVARWHSLTADGVHPGPAGHAVLADRVGAWLRAAGEGPAPDGR